MTLYSRDGSPTSTMLRLSVFLAWVTTVLCHGFGRPGLIVQQQSPIGGPECRPVRSFVTHVQTVVQEQPILKTIQQQQVQFLTEYKQRFVTVTTGTVAYVTTGVQSTIINTRTRTLTQRNTVTNTQYVYIPTIETALVAGVFTSINTYTQVAYETVFTPIYVTTTQTTVTTELTDQIVYEPVFETRTNFVADSFTTTVVEQIPDYSTLLVQVQDSGTVVHVPVNKIVYETQVLQEKANVYVTSRVQAIEYHTVTAPAANVVTVAVNCLGLRSGGGLIEPAVNLGGPADVGFGALAGVVVSPSTGVDPRSNGVPLALALPVARTGDVAAADGVTNATDGAVARAGPVSDGVAVDSSVSAGPLVSPGVLLSSNLGQVISGTSSV